MRSSLSVALSRRLF